ncbi:Guanylate kinase [Lachnospiraceae bacterium TWA4]|nr:Guanylate kinase [Lachnospiraceae bacterium TWA4]
MQKYPYVESISWTTRQPREGEKDGIDYFFHTQEEFDKLIDENGFAEYARYVGKSYGSPKKFIEEQINKGISVILEIELQGAMQVLETYPEARLLFVTTSSGYRLKEQLEGRGTEDSKQVRGRLTRAIEEADGVKNYHAIVVNEVVEDSAEKVHELIEQENCPVLTEEDLQVIYKVKEDLKKF